MKKKIGILVDSNAGIRKEEIEKLKIFVLPMPFIIDGEEFFEGVNLDSKEFYEKLVNDANIHTSQPSIGSIQEMYREILKEYEYVLHIPMSSALSKTYETSLMIANDDEFKGKVAVCDNHMISITIYQSVLEAIELIELGKDVFEIKDILESIKDDCSIYLMVDTLKYLKKGGRITPAAAILGSLLGIKPVLQIQGGKLDAFSKCRTTKSAKKVMIEQIKKDIETRFGDEYIVYIVECYSNGEINNFLEEAKQELNNVEEQIEKLSFSIACHTGPGVLAIGCCKKHHFK